MTTELIGQKDYLQWPKATKICNNHVKKDSLLAQPHDETKKVDRQLVHKFRSGMEEEERMTTGGSENKHT